MLHTPEWQSFLKTVVKPHTLSIHAAMLAEHTHTHTHTHVASSDSMFVRISTYGRVRNAKNQYPPINYLTIVMC